MLDVGRLCVKTAGREAGKKCVIVEPVDKNFLVIDGNVRRKRCNIAHLEPLKETLEIGKGASREEIREAFKKAGILAEPKKVKRAEKPLKPKKEGSEEQKKEKTPKRRVKKETKAKEQS